MRKSNQVQVGNVKIGGGAPIAIQSMTNTETSDIDATVNQIIELYNAGSEIVRFTVNSTDAAKAVPGIKEELQNKGYNIPLVGDFHYNGHILLNQYPQCARALDKYRINPGNVGQYEYNFKSIVETAINNNKPIRIGVNWGSLDQSIFTELMEQNTASPEPKSDKEILYEAMVQSTLSSAAEAEKIGLPADKIIVSAKVSDVQDVIKVNRMLAQRCDYPIHLGLTEAGMGDKGVVASAAALGVLLQEGIGDTIRVSITPKPGDSRIREVEICQLILQTMGIRQFKPLVSSCPGCGRTSGDFYQHLAQEVNEYISANINEWKKKYPGVEKLKIAVMGCVVNGPGESKHADIGISLPGKTEKPVAPVYIKGKPFAVLEGEDISAQFIKIVQNYVQNHFSPHPNYDLKGA